MAMHDLRADFALHNPIPLTDRATIEVLIEALIATLDTIDGDPDVEDATDAEEDFSISPWALRFTDGPGCEVGDPSGQCDEDGINTGSLSFAMHGHHDEGPGCPIADPGGL